MNTLLKILKYLTGIMLIIIIGIVLLYGHRDIPLETLKAKYTNKASSFVDVGGMMVHYRDEGNPSDSIPLVLIHGTGSSLHTFDVWAEYLKNHKRVIRMDLPAYGLTGPFPDHDYSIDHYASFLKDFLNGIGIKNCVIAGNSLGGAIAWRFTVEEPEMVNQLILIDAAGYPSSARSVPVAFKMARMPVLNKALTYITPKFLARASVENVYFDKSKVTDELVDRYFELTLRPGNREAFVNRLKSHGNTSSHDLIQSIRQRTLILWGANDLLIPVDHAHRFAEDLPNDTLVIMENTGHCPMEESPLESLEVVMGFLDIGE